MVYLILEEVPVPRILRSWEREEEENGECGVRLGGLGKFLRCEARDGSETDRDCYGRGGRWEKRVSVLFKNYMRKWGEWVTPLFCPGSERYSAILVIGFPNCLEIEAELSVVFLHFLVVAVLAGGKTFAEVGRLEGMGGRMKQVCESIFWVEDQS